MPESEAVLHLWSSGGRLNRAPRISAGSEAVEEGPAGFASVEECADAVVGEAAESEGGAFDSSYEVVDGYLEGWRSGGPELGCHVGDMSRAGSGMRLWRR